MIGRRLGPYTIESRLGEGGMGTVWSALDSRLERRVALKLIREDQSDPETRERFWREARAAAAVSHPGICQVFDIDEREGMLYIAMELLVGETLADRLQRGALEPEEAVTIGAEILEALAALHERRLVHRDLKPSNVFLPRTGGVKLMDFGLVRPLTTREEESGQTPLTAVGAIVGTPAYMAPEQIHGDSVDHRADLFSAAAILHEMVSGRSPFRRRSIAETLAAVLRDEAPALAGPIARVLARSLRKQAADRHPSASSFASELRSAAHAPAATTTASSQDVDETLRRAPLPTAASSSGRGAPPDASRRLVVLPFRFLRPDPDLDFLGFSLADAVALSLSELGSLLVRSTVAAARFAGPAPDLAELARGLDVDVVLLGTILRAGSRCRVAAQLVEAPGGRVLWTQTVESAVDDVFELQDTLSRRIVDELRLPLGGSGTSALARDVPRNAEAYELFLRANQASATLGDLSVARGLYRRSLELDRSFAPAWARLGRCYRIEAKYRWSGREENNRLANEALGKALELNPDLALAHRLYAQLEVDLGRPESATERLLATVRKKPNDPAGWAGLVMSLRYLGLLTESLAADRRARRLDPYGVTSAFHTYIALDDHQGMLARGPEEGDDAAALIYVGRREEALAMLAEERLTHHSGGAFRDWLRMLRWYLLDDVPSLLSALPTLGTFPDAEGRYYGARLTARHAPEGAAAIVLGCVRQGFVNVPFLRTDRMIEPLRCLPDFEAAMAEAVPRHEAALARFGGAVT